MFLASISDYFIPETIKSSTAPITSVEASRNKTETATNKKLSATKRPYIKTEKGMTPKKKSSDDKEVIEIADSDSNQEGEPNKPHPESSVKETQVSIPPVKQPKKDKKKSLSTMLLMKSISSR